MTGAGALSLRTGTLPSESGRSLTPGSHATLVLTLERLALTLVSCHVSARPSIPPVHRHCWSDSMTVPVSSLAYTPGPEGNGNNAYKSTLEELIKRYQTSRSAGRP